MVTTHEIERIDRAYGNLIRELNGITKKERYTAVVMVITELVDALAKSYKQTVPETYKDIVSVHRDCYEDGRGSTG